MMTFYHAIWHSIIPAGTLFQGRAPQQAVLPWAADEITVSAAGERVDLEALRDQGWQESEESMHSLAASTP